MLLILKSMIVINEPYLQLCHDIKMADVMGGTMYKDPMERLTFCYIHCEQCRRKLRRDIQTTFRCRSIHFLALKSPRAGFLS